MNDISQWIKKYCTDNKITCLIVGVSGGIDSALTSTLCALTGIKTYTVTMSIHQAIDQYTRGIDHINWLKSKHDNIIHIDKDLTSFYDSFVSIIDDIGTNQLGLANTRARIRMLTLYYIAQVNNGIVVGTGNKIEDFGVGFFTKYGDGGVDISPIANLTKTEVRKMSKELGISEEILKAHPTDGLWEDGRTDEDQLGATYEELEWCMENIETIDYGIITPRQQDIISIYTRFRKQNLHKMIPIPVYEGKK